MSLPYKIKVFIAGSKDLYHERNAVRSQLQQISNRTNIVFASYTYEDFSRDFALDGRQTDYNGFIAHKADFAVFIIDGKIGGITFEEFKVAVEAFKREMKPRIFTYCKDVNVDDHEINQIIHDINECHQYYCDYKDIFQLESGIYRDFMNIAWEFTQESTQLHRYSDIAASHSCYSRYPSGISHAWHGVVISVGGKEFCMPEEFFNEEIYKALKRSYGK